MIDHICPEPGCGMLEERVLVERLTTSHDEHYIYECPRNADAHALCARVAKLEEQLAEADHCIAWMADPGVGTDPRYMGRLANMRGMAAQDAAIEREEARKKGAEHGE